MPLPVPTLHAHFRLNLPRHRVILRPILRCRPQARAGAQGCFGGNRADEQAARGNQRVGEKLAEPPQLAVAANRLAKEGHQPPDAGDGGYRQADGGDAAGNQKTNYGKSVQSLYRRQGSLDKLLFILSAEDFAQSLRRMRYLREYAEWQRMQAASIVDKQNEISRKKGELEKTRTEKQALLTERETENQKLQTEESNQKQEVSQLNKKRKDLQAQLAKKRRQAEALNRQIEKLIAEEIARAEAAERARRKQAEAKKAAASEERVAETKGGYAMTKAERQLSGSFASNKGRLPYPVTGRHTVVATFGEQQHQELKYVRTNNSGIDIQTSPGADARAVFNGTVTRVFTLPGYNNSIIVRHGNYLTVYSNLSQVYVKAGDQVSTRQALGRIFTDTDDGNATILHFQLWKEKQKQNPLPWLE